MKKLSLLSLLLTSFFAINALSDGIAPISGFAPTSPARERALRNAMESKCKRAQAGIYNFDTTSIVNLTPALIEKLKASDMDACQRLGK